jgi:PAS domain S-box-containing protein
MNMADDHPTGDIEEMETRVVGLSREFEAGQNRFSQIVESLPVPLAVLGLSNHKILLTNSCLDEALGAPRGSLLDQDWTRLFPDLDDRRRLKKLEAKKDGIRGVEVQGRHEDGTSLCFSVWQRRLVRYDKECLLTILIDITDRKAAELEQKEKDRTLSKLLDLSDRDRELIAYEIHDGFVQDMLTTLMHLDVCRGHTEKGGERALRELDLARDSLRQGVKEARHLIDGVRMPDLTSAGLVGALRMLADRISGDSNVSIDLVSDLSFPRLPPECEIAVYRMVQESLNNVRRHSKSQNARVELKDREDRVKVVIRDWGVGFDPEEVDENCFGLMGMRHRANLFGGKVEIKSGPKYGTKVTLILPLESKTRESGGVRSGSC